MRHVGISAKRGSVVGNRVASEREGIGVLVMVRWPEGDRRIRSLRAVVSNSGEVAIRRVLAHFQRTLVIITATSVLHMLE